MVGLLFCFFVSFFFLLCIKWNFWEKILTNVVKIDYFSKFNWLELSVTCFFLWSSTCKMQLKQNIFFFFLRFSVMACCWAMSYEERPKFSQLLVCLQDFYTALGRYIWKIHLHAKNHYNHHHHRHHHHHCHFSSNMLRVAVPLNLPIFGINIHFFNFFFFFNLTADTETYPTFILYSKTF